ncbi:MAG: GGDEF domain-containing protein [Clostridium sp.]|nr:GGDEF domain-containing protein [Clostridium sp.]
MEEVLQFGGFLLMDYVAMVVYAKRAVCYAKSLLDAQRQGNSAVFYGASLVFLWMVVFSGLPVIVVFLFLYSVLLLYFLLFFGNGLPVALFASGTFMFHIADLYMLLFGIFSLNCGIGSMEGFRENYLYLVLVLLVILVSMVCLEIFSRVIDQVAIQILIENKRQLRFAATSLMFIDIYLLILSVVYDSSTYTGLILMFLVITAVLLVGAFYTSFLHAVRMSVLERYESMFKDMESQLEQSNRSLGKLKDEVYTDVLTGAASRRYGLLKLDRMVQDRKKLSVSLVDLDGLKAVNDNLGHQEGDRYLVGVSHVLSGRFGAKFVCRLGGDEFLVILPDKTEREADILMKEACREMEESFRRQGMAFGPSVSYGIAELDQLAAGSVSGLLELADRRMYEMKRERHKMRQ